MKARAALLVVTALWGCGASTATRVERVRETTLLARERGAYRCAPVALARAEVHLELAKIELSAGELMRAEHALDVADAQAGLALRDAAGCLAKKPVVAEVRSTLAPGPAPLPAPPRDRDGDGILDATDRCPDEPEDRDGWQDEDGCPDPDDDGDGIPDGEDRCPRQAGPPEAGGCPDRDQDHVADADDRCPDLAGDPANGGCPAPKLIVVREDKIELKQKIHFATGKATILPFSFPMLGEIAEALRTRPTVRVRIEGHTDSRGSAKLNTRLSRARADAVRSHLIGAGIDGQRLEAVGFGPAQPIADNRTSAGREENRRVEFFLLNP